MKVTLQQLRDWWTELQKNRYLNYCLRNVIVCDDEESRLLDAFLADSRDYLGVDLANKGSGWKIPGLPEEVMLQVRAIMERLSPALAQPAVPIPRFNSQSAFKARR